MTTEMPYNTEPAAEDSPETSATVLQSPFCGGLRSKKFFILDAVIATDASQYLDGSNHCWCYETQQVFGPDGDSVNPSQCVPGRSCYKSALEDNV